MRKIISFGVISIFLLVQLALSEPYTIPETSEINTTVEFIETWEGNYSSWIFESNTTGTLTNSTENFYFNDSKSIHKLLINSSTFDWRFYANSTEENWSMTEIKTFNAIIELPPIYNITENETIENETNISDNNTEENETSIIEDIPSMEELEKLLGEFEDTLEKIELAKQNIETAIENPPGMKEIDYNYQWFTLNDLTYGIKTHDEWELGTKNSIYLKIEGDKELNLNASSIMLRSFEGDLMDHSQELEKKGDNLYQTTLTIPEDSNMDTYYLEVRVASEGNIGFSVVKIDAIEREMSSFEKVIDFVKNIFDELLKRKIEIQDKFEEKVGG